MSNPNTEPRMRHLPKLLTAMLCLAIAGLLISCAEEVPPTPVPTPEPSPTLLPRNPDSVGELTNRISQQDKTADATSSPTWEKPEIPTAEPLQLDQTTDDTAETSGNQGSQILLIAIGAILAGCLLLVSLLLANILLTARRRRKTTQQATEGATDDHIQSAR